MTAGGSARSVVFLTEHRQTSLSLSRFLFRLADNVSAFGYRTGLVNLGPGLPRPDWLVPPYLSLQNVEQFRQIMSASPERLIIATTWQTYYLARGEDLLGDGTMLLLDELGTSAVHGMADAALFVQALTQGEVLTHSPYVEEVLQRTGRRSVLMGAPVDARFFSATRIADERSVLYLSFPDRLEDDDLAADAFSRVRERLKGLTLNTYGYDARTKYSATLASHTHMPWGDDDIETRAAAYERAGCLVWTRSSEALPIAVLESMAAGCPVVCVGSEQNASLCQDEVNCLAVAREACAVADAIVRVLTDSAIRERLTKNGRESVEGRTWQATLEDLPEMVRRERRPERARGIGAIKWRPDYRDLTPA